MSQKAGLNTVRIAVSLGTFSPQVHNPALDFRCRSRPEGGNDGRFLKLGLEGIAGILIDASRRDEDRPDRDRVALRFELFKNAA